MWDLETDRTDGQCRQSDMGASAMTGLLPLQLKGKNEARNYVSFKFPMIRAYFFEPQ